MSPFDAIQNKPKHGQKKEMRVQGSQDPNNSHMYKLQFKSIMDSVEMVRQISKKQFKIEIKVDQHSKTNRNALLERQRILKEKQTSQAALDAQKLMRTSRSAKNYFQKGHQQQSPTTSQDESILKRNPLGERGMRISANDSSIQDLRSPKDQSPINLKIDS